MKVNGKDISLFGARLVDYTISGTPITQYSSDLMRYGVPNKYGTKTGNKTITINLTFNPTWIPSLSYVPSIREKLNKVASQITSFDAELLNSDKVMIELPDRFMYICIPVSFGTATDDGSAVCDSTYIFTGIKVLPMITVTPDYGTVICRSNVETDCVIKMTASADISVVEILGIKVNNLRKNDVVVIDGMKKTVLCNDVNKFADVDLTAFPTLQPGKNTIDISPVEKLDTYISYYPTFV